VPTFHPDVTTLRFYALGDTGTGNAGQAAVANAMVRFQAEFTAGFALLLGDNFYPRGVLSTSDHRWRDRFEEVYDPTELNLHFYAVLGNHDYRRNEKAQVAYTSEHPESRWKMPGRYYSFNHELPDGTRIEFFGIDTNTIETEEVQLAWLIDALSQSSADWKIVFGHHVLYSNGHYGSNRKLIARLQELFIRGGVDLYLAGHEHDLQILDPVFGVSYMVSGAGSRTRKTGCGDNTVYSAGLPGFMAFEVSGDRLLAYVLLADGGIDHIHTLRK
jgi:predicted MPP superfamily phosphohydrolase